MSFNQNLLEVASDQINAALKALLDTDPANELFIAKLEGIKVKVLCTQPKFGFLIQFIDGSISLNTDTLSKDSDDEADLQLSGTGINLLKLVTTPIENASGLRNANISVNGDVGLLLELSQTTKKIDIDWELLLTDRIGETPAVLISRTISSGFREAKKIHSDLLNRLTEKMQSASSPFPNKNELSQLKSQLRDLNYRLDRLEAHTKQPDAVESNS